MQNDYPLRVETSEMRDVRNNCTFQPALMTQTLRINRSMEDIALNASHRLNLSRTARSVSKFIED